MRSDAAPGIADGAHNANCLPGNIKLSRKSEQRSKQIGREMQQVPNSQCINQSPHVITPLL
jgi:hypothetical protein